MRNFTILLISAICIGGISVRSQQFDDTAFCETMHKFAANANKDAGSLVDAHTRNDGMAVLCATKVVDFKKFIDVPQDAMRPGWKDRKSDQWRNIYCNDPFWRSAIQNGWTVATTIVTVDGDRTWIEAVCK